MGRAKAKPKRRPTNSQALKSQNQKLPFAEHVYELRRRLMYVAASVVLCGGVAYGFEQHIVNILLRPAHNQQFIYTSVGGGIDFLFRVCLYAGIAASIPVIVYQLLRYVQPLIQEASVRLIAWGSLVSGLFAIAGVVYGYVWGLPAALHFLLHQFVTAQIRPLVTIQSYMNFVTVYMLGSALLFQVPLFMIFINRIRPLKPQRLFHYERWVILLAFVGAGIMNPSPNLLAQLLLAGPIILMYQVGIGIVWLTNRRAGRPAEATSLLQRDEEIRAARLAHFQLARTSAQTPRPAAAPSPSAAAKPRPQPASAAPQASVPVMERPSVGYAKRPPAAIRPRRYVDDFRLPRRSYIDPSVSPEI